MGESKINQYFEEIDVQATSAEYNRGQQQWLSFYNISLKKIINMSVAMKRFDRSKQACRYLSMVRFTDYRLFRLLSLKTLSGYL